MSCVVSVAAEKSLIAIRITYLPIAAETLLETSFCLRYPLKLHSKMVLLVKKTLSTSEPTTRNALAFQIWYFAFAILYVLQELFFVVYL